MNVQNWKKIILTILLPIMAAGFVLLFLLLFCLILLLLAMLSVGLLAIPVGLAAMFGFLPGLVSELAPPVIVLVGLGLICLGISFGTALMLFSPDCVRLLHRVKAMYSRLWR